MAQNSQNQPTKTLTVLERIKAFFKLDDAGRVENFFKSEIKAMRLRIRAIEMNMKSDELKLEIDLATIDSTSRRKGKAWPFEADFQAPSVAVRAVGLAAGGCSCSRAR